MIKLNWIVILTILVLSVLLYINNSEHFAGALTTQNAEAVANISSMVNSGNLTATNITASNSLVVPGNNKITLSSADGNKILIDAISGKLPFFINNGIDMGCYDSWRIFNNGDARFNNITSPTIDAINARISALESKTQNITRDSGGNLLVGGKIRANEGIYIPYLKTLQFGRSGDDWTTTFGTREGRVDLDVWRTPADGTITVANKAAYITRW